MKIEGDLEEVVVDKFNTPELLEVETNEEVNKCCGGRNYINAFKYLNYFDRYRTYCIS